MSKVAVVTGGTRGIGAQIARVLKNDGFTVAVIYAGRDEVAAAFHAETGIKTYKCDVGDFASTQSTLASIEKDLGAVEVLVNNAGITRDGMFHKMSAEQWNAVISVNLSSLFNMCRPVIEGMRERGFGRIINISSVNGQQGQMGQANYCAAKAGVIGFTKALALENATKGITVNCVCPGYVDTDMVAAVDEKVLQKIIGRIPVGRLGTAEDIAAAVSFLVSDKSSFITGSTISINGGQYLA